MRKWIPLMALLTLLPVTAAAQPVWTSQGAELLPAGWALEPMIGFPEVGVRFHIPVGGVEVVPKVALFYGEDLALMVGNSLGVQVKIPVYRNGIWSVSINPEFSLLLGYWGGPGGHFNNRFFRGNVTGFSFGVRVDPEAIATVRPLEWLAVYFGMHIPLTFWATPNFLARIPILMKAGVEFTVSRRFNLWVTPLDVGPAIYARRNFHDVWLSYSFMAGAAIPF